MVSFIEIVSNQVNNRVEHMKSKVPSCMLDFYNALKPHKKGSIWFRVSNHEASLAVAFMNIFYNYDTKLYKIIIMNKLDPDTNKPIVIADIADFCQVVNIVMDNFYFNL